MPGGAGGLSLAAGVLALRAQAAAAVLAARAQAAAGVLAARAQAPAAAEEPGKHAPHPLGPGLLGPHCCHSQIPRWWSPA